MSETSSDRSVEFDLPLRVRTAIARIKAELIEPARQAFAKSAAERDAAIKRANQTLKSVEADFDAKSSNHRTRASQATADAAKASAELRAALDVAEKWREGSKLESPSATAASGSPRVTTGTTIDEITALRRHIEEMVANTKPTYAPSSPWAQWAVALGSFTGLIIFAPLVLVWPVAVYLLQLRWYAVSVEKLAEVHAKGDELLASLAATQGRVDAEAERTVRDLEQAMLVPARARAQAAKQLANQEFERERSGVETQVRRQAVQFDREITEIWKQAGCTGADWSAPEWHSWKPDSSPHFSGRIGAFHVAAPDLQRQLSGMSLAFRLPALVPFVDGRCLLLNAPGAHRTAAT